jgi:hypothetical protein
MTICLLCALALLGTALPASSSIMDRLIRHEYIAHREQWERDGRPIGPFFTPEDARVFTSRWSLRVHDRLGI